MLKVAVKRIDDRLGYDLGAMASDLTKSLFYDGRPCLVDSFMISQLPTESEAILSHERFEQIMKEYQEGGDCTGCNEPARKLRTLTAAEAEAIGYAYDPDHPERLCLKCWREERSDLIYETRKNELIDLGPFDENDDSEPCSICSTCTTVYEEFEGRVICESCGEE